MTLQQAVDRIKRRSHRGDTATTSSDGGVTADILDAINDTRRDILSTIPKYFLRVTPTTITLSSGTSLYSLGATVGEPFLLRYTLSNTDYYLHKVDDERDFYQRIFQSGASNALPVWYFDAGIGTDANLQRRIVVFPTPDRTITLTVHHYARWTTEELTTSDLSAQIPEIPIQFHNTVWKGGLYYFLRSFDDPMLIKVEQEYKESLAQMEAWDFKNLDKDASFKMGKQVVKQY